MVIMRVTQLSVTLLCCTALSAIHVQALRPLTDVQAPLKGPKEPFTGAQHVTLMRKIGISRPVHAAMSVLT